MIIRIITRRRREVFFHPFHNNLCHELFPFLRLQEPEVIRIVIEEALDEYCRAGGVAWMLTMILPYAIFELGVGEFGNDNFSVETEGGEF